ncbi:YwbE family protein [candidate division WWE3 bacterium]|uniref:YwbE family protein n=1 Tax=candidate division WWE3 bacterium TaxID=2053526 RepID=A0A955RXB1_UNCKA|nr:YwbE family protein [candidate division WWE3 bacterium]
MDLNEITIHSHDNAKGEVPARKDIHVGQTVWAVEKKNYASGQLTEGVVKRILTSKPHHPRGTKVMFEDGTVARVQTITPPDNN